MTERRADILVSVCFPEVDASDRSARALRQAADTIGARFRYWEMLVIVDADKAETIDPMLETIRNLRILQVRRTAQIYRKRTVAASEAIGDVVVLTSVDEAPCLDLVAMIERAHAESSLIIGERGRSGAADRILLDPLIRTLGRGSGLRVTTRDMVTTAYPRTLLNRILARDDRQLALRFPPREEAIPVRRQPCRSETPALQPGFALARRLGLVQKLLVNSAPMVLSSIALLSTLVTLVAGIYALYTLFVWGFQSDVQPGWVTTSLALSLTAGFLGAALFGMSTGLQKVIELLAADTLDDVVDERNSVDLFSQVTQDLNVEIATDAEEAAPAPRRHSA